MTSEATAASTNRILAALSAAARRALWPSLSRFYLPRWYLLHGIGTGISHLYFIERGLVSLVTRMPDGRSAEIGAIGREGIAPPTGVFDVDQTIMESIVQIPVEALRIERRAFKRWLEGDCVSGKLLHGYASLVMSQLAQTSACNILHPIEARCARRLLTAHDSVLGSGFSLTHESLATSLSVRRESVSVAAAALQKAGLIRYIRGKMIVADRLGLERVACECYATIRQRIESLLRGRPAAGA